MGNEVWKINDFVKAGFHGRSVDLTSISTLTSDLYTFTDIQTSPLGAPTFFAWDNVHIKQASTSWHLYSIPFSEEDLHLTEELQRFLKKTCPNMKYTLSVEAAQIVFTFTSDKNILVLDDLFLGHDVIPKQFPDVGFDVNKITKKFHAGDPNVNLRKVFHCPADNCHCNFLSSSSAIKHIEKSQSCQARRKKMMETQISSNKGIVEACTEEYLRTQFRTLNRTYPSKRSCSFELKWEKSVFEMKFGFSGWKPDWDGYEYQIESWEEYSKAFGVTPFHYGSSKHGTKRLVGVCQDCQALLKLKRHEDPFGSYHMLEVTLPVA